MKIKLTSKAERGIGLRSMSTGKLTRYETGDVLEVADNIAIGLVNSGLATEIEASEDDTQQTPAGETEQNPDDEEQNTEDDAEGDAEGEEQNAEDDATAGTPYDNMSKDELIALCKERGKTSRGTKEELIARLMEE